MNILFLPKHEYLGASSRYRTLQYIPFLQSKGVNCVVKPLFTDKYLNYKYLNGKENKILTLQRIIGRIKVILLDSSRFDVLVIEKELLPYFPPLLEWFLKLRNVKYIVDYDDAVWHNYDQHSNLLVKKFLGSKIKSVIKNAEAVIGGSNYINDFVWKLRLQNVFKIPTVIDLKKYAALPQTKNNSPFIIGWIGSPSSSQYLLGIGSILKKFTSTNNAIVHLIGFDSALESNLDFPYKIIEWDEETEVVEIKNFDVGIMPLPDTPFERGKCGFKLIQYMGCKKPVIASPVYENNIIVDEGLNGFLAWNDEDWLQGLNKVFRNREYAEYLGTNGFDKIKQYYSLGVTQEKYLEIIKKVYRIESINDLQH